MATRAKFECEEVEELNDMDGNVSQQNVRFHPVYSEAGENRDFWEATPSGAIQMTINNKQAFGEFKKGRQYYVDFTEAS